MRSFLRLCRVFKQLIVRGCSAPAKSRIKDKDVKIGFNDGPVRIIKRFWAEICENTLH